MVCNAQILEVCSSVGSSALASFGLFFAGMLFLVLLFRSKKIVRQLELWKDRFRQCGVSPKTYRGSAFSQQHVVYVGIPMLAVTRKGLVSSTSPSSKSKPVKHSMFYVGSTTITLARRDADRYRKFKQLFATLQFRPSRLSGIGFIGSPSLSTCRWLLFLVHVRSVLVCARTSFCRCGGLG